jgi:hypothetical protein
MLQSLQSSDLLHLLTGGHIWNSAFKLMRQADKQLLLRLLNMQSMLQSREDAERQGTPRARSRKIQEIARKLMMSHARDTYGLRA